jgi:hypothetical protein
LTRHRAAPTPAALDAFHTELAERDDDYFVEEGETKMLEDILRELLGVRGWTSVSSSLSWNNGNAFEVKLRSRIIATVLFEDEEESECYGDRCGGWPSVTYG